MSEGQLGKGVKICGVCGKDVSRVARVKDETGKYYCEGACFQKHKASLHKPAAAAVAEPPVVKPPVVVPPKPASPETYAVDPALNPAFLDSGSKASDKAPGVRCPSCGAPMNLDSILCTGCGYSAKRGARLATKRGVIKEKKERTNRSVGVAPGVVAMIIFLLVAGLLLSGFAHPAMFLVGLLAWAILGLVATILLVVRAFTQGAAGWGLFMLFTVFGSPVITRVYPLWAIVHLIFVICVLYYAFFVNEDEMSKGLYAAHVVLTIAIMIGAYTFAADAIEKAKAGGSGTSMILPESLDRGYTDNPWPTPAMA